MALKLKDIISMENENYEEVAPEIAEGAVDEVEAVEAADEIVEETDALDEYSEELDETVEDVQELEETQEVLETALENPDYEGLDEVSAEMINRRLKVLSERRGFDVSRVDGVFSKETFGVGASGRRRKTQLALEGIKDTIVAMWERIKSAVKAVWQAIKDFWKKHISTMGRLLKALDKAKKRARDISGAPGDASKIKPSSALQRGFFGKEAIGAKIIKTYLSRQDAATGLTIEYLRSLTTALNSVVSKSGDDYKFIENVSDDQIEALHKFAQVGTEKEPLVNGFFAEYDTSGLSDENPTFEFKWDQRKSDLNDKRGFNIASKGDMKDILESAIDLIKTTQRLGENFNKVSGDFDKAMNKFSQAISSLDEETEADDVKGTRLTMKFLNDNARLLPKINSKIAGLNVTAAKLTLSYCNTSMANYKN